jgi:hypothetical protein
MEDTLDMKTFYVTNKESGELLLIVEAIDEKQATDLLKKAEHDLDDIDLEECKHRYD